ncbi:MAG: succinylglutamate desuccinylase/aspartoacylase family protein [Parcubacteria group bacterium]|nr:succinylglutamate desuccinylase/aspartoacylase family protein [Parcubacteria group bacterium]
MKEIGDHIWQTVGIENGPHIMIIGGTHGNERTGVEVIRALVDQDFQIDAGVLTLALGNLKAIEIDERGSEPSHDLNRTYRSSLLETEPTGTYEDQRARELAPHLKAADYVIDLHATNKPSEAFLCSLLGPEQQKLHKFFPVSKVLSDRRYVLGNEPVTTDEYAETFGGTGMCYETGLASDTYRVKEVLGELSGMFSGMGLISGQPTPPGETSQKDHYELTLNILLTEAGFTWAPGFGNGSWESFMAGQTVGYHGEELLVPDYDGVVVFPKIAKHLHVGGSVGFLAKRIDSDKI